MKAQLNDGLKLSILEVSSKLKNYSLGRVNSRREYFRGIKETSEQLIQEIACIVSGKQQYEQNKCLTLSFSCSSSTT